jgi:periplasmic protein CpxP/Spy
MKSMIKKSLIGLVGTGVLLLGAAGCSHQSGGRHMSDTSRTEFRGKMIDKVAAKLELNEMQKQKLAVLATKMQEQRSAFMGDTAIGGPREQAKAVIAGTSFDKVRAQALIDGKTQAVKTKSPEVIAAAADFFDSLNPAQQQQVRDFMNRGRGWGRG